MVADRKALSCARYRVVFEAREPLDLPGYLGSTLRGAFGHAFRAVACPAPRGLDCPAPAQCPYHLIFETSPPPGSEALRTHDEIPRPFVIAPEDSEQGSGEQSRRLFRCGDEVSFELVLIGRAQEFFPYFVVALREVNQMGRGRQAVELRRIEALCRRANESRVVYTASENLVRGSADSISIGVCDPVPDGPLTIEFLTQTRLKHEGRFVRTPEFQILFRRLLGRLSSLSRFHCGAPLEVDFSGLIDRSASIRLLQDDTRWTRWQRYSSRQDRRMEWEGIVGRATYEGDFAPFWDYLRFGQFIHVGHGATFGLGKYRPDSQVIRSS
ncbi:MAG: CRISPR system precrRNA processing endoribonuclease RAMP protein Cas6 [Candidatus Binatus sp.]